MDALAKAQKAAGRFEQTADLDKAKEYRLTAMMYALLAIAEGVQAQVQAQTISTVGQGPDMVVRWNVSEIDLGAGDD